MIILQSYLPSYNYQQDKATYYDCWITLQTALKIAASNLYCKITLVWLESSLSVPLCMTTTYFVLFVSLYLHIKVYHFKNNCFVYTIQHQMIHKYSVIGLYSPFQERSVHTFYSTHTTIQFAHNLSLQLSFSHLFPHMLSWLCMQTQYALLHNLWHTVLYF